MKKVFTIVAVMLLIGVAQAQNYVEVNVIDIENGATLYYCYDEYDGVIVHGRPECVNEWSINGQHYEGDSIIVYSVEDEYANIHHTACGHGIIFLIEFPSSNIPNPFEEPIIWKRYGKSITLFANSYGYTIIWSTGEITEEIEIIEPGLYSVTIADTEFAGCVDTTFSVEVRDNVEIESASVDPDSNKNLVTWETTPEQAEYISQVTIARDGVDIATVHYTDGQFLDNIGSDLAARIYTITGVCADGTLCPIPSLERGTIHMAFLPDINGNVEMTWNAPHLGGAPIHVGRYEICEYDPSTTEIAVVDFVSPSTMSYSCNQSMFNYGYPLIRAIIQDGRGEKDMLSNRMEDLVGIDEQNGEQDFKVYPNPAIGRVTIEGTGTAIITNALGQTVLTKEIDGKATIELPRGLYFVKLNGIMRKIVVE